MNFIKNLFTKTATKVTTAILLLLVIVSVFVFWGWYVKQVNKVRGMYHVYQGDKAYKQHKLQKAINSYNKGLKLYPEHAKARCNLGNIYVMYEDFFSAANSYEEALKHSPNFNVCRMNLGIIEAEKLANYDSAIRQYDTIIKSKPRIWQIPFIYNNWKSTKLNRAIASYNKGLAFRGKSLFVGEKSFTSRQYLEKSEAAYKYALKTLKKDYDTHYNLALTNQRLGDYREAGLEYCKAINIEPMNYEAHYNLAILLRHIGHYKEALIEFEKAGMLLDAKGDATLTKHVYDVLNEVNQKLVQTGQYDFLKNHHDGYKPVREAPKLRNGLIVIEKNDKRKMYNYLRSCPSKKLFKEFETDEK